MNLNYRNQLCSTKLVFVGLLLAIVWPFQASAVEIDFTRHISRHGIDGPAIDSATFFGVPGPARLIITSVGNEVDVTVELNGSEVVGAESVSAEKPLEIPVSLVGNNSLTVRLNGLAGTSISVRIKQIADVELHVQSRVHFNTNVSNFVAAREFYGKLGFETLTGFPDTNTQEMARAIGIETPTSYDGAEGETAGGYLLHGELVGVGGFTGGMIDLIEFTVPRNEEPPYQKLNHLGMARAAIRTTNIAADYEYMSALGVEFISAPTTRSDGTRFAIFADLDGTHYELIEIDGDDEVTDTTHFVDIGQVNVNVTDFERSRAWYQMLGFGTTKKLAATDSIEVANAMGFKEPYEINGAIVTHEVDGSTLEIVQWISPHDPERAYDIPVNHFGIHRMAFSTTDIVADVAALKAQGVEFVSPITPCCSGNDSSSSIVAFYDPDGTIVELVEPPFIMQLLTSLLSWLSDLFQ